ncbi:sugar-transfer associated ATP-grasp domain-containing protein [Spongiimicrobium salis]|uniref:sugar-transfer associated ATP-grasp domain-containing protein n=1 Tax=Spongiimicrobium salis TaxID=1667022 RepID=UPI00374D668D
MKLLYFFYLLKKTRFSTLIRQIKHLKKIKKWSYFKVLSKVLGAFLQYNTAFLDYFSFKFYEKSEAQKAAFIDPIFLYKFQKALNKREDRKYFKNKDLFLEKFKAYIDHDHFLPFENDLTSFTSWLKQRTPASLILKSSTGYQGVGIEKVQVLQKGNIYFFNSMNIESFYVFLKKNRLDLIEVAIEQHPILNHMYSGSLNTIRIITVVDSQKKVHFLGAMLRVGTTGFVDNFSAGGVSAQIDLKTGIVIAPLVSKDSRLIHESGKHPITHKDIIGVALPFWVELKEMVGQAALVVPSVRTVGWDVAITSKGPYLLEGNDNWNQVIWQRTSDEGYKKELEEFLN